MNRMALTQVSKSANDERTGAHGIISRSVGVEVTDTTDLETCDPCERGKPITSIIQLRDLLVKRFSSVHLGSEQAMVKSAAFWPTGIDQMDRVLGGGLPKSAVTELVSPRLSSGSALVLLALLRQARRSNQWVALVDAHDSFDVSKLGESVFDRLLWVRCRETAQALKATDLLLRDGNLALVLMDLLMNPAAELRKIPASAWHRWQRLLERISTALLVLTPRPMVNGVRARLELKGCFALQAIQQREEELLSQLNLVLKRGNEVPAATLHRLHAVNASTL